MDGDAGRRREPAARSPTGRADRSCAPGASPPTTGLRGHTVPEPSPGEAEASLEKLTAPRDGLGPVIARSRTLRSWGEAAASAPEEPVAVDAARASSSRYTSRSYLLQRRTGTAGTALVDPRASAMPASLQKTLSGREWVLHAASQARPSLSALGLVP